MVAASNAVQTSSTDRRELELMLLQDIQQSLSAGEIDRARRELERFDKQYPNPYTSRERDELAARIRQADTRTSIPRRAR